MQACMLKIHQTYCTSTFLRAACLVLWLPPRFPSWPLLPSWPHYHITFLAPSTASRPRPPPHWIPCPWWVGVVGGTGLKSLPDLPEPASLELCLQTQALTVAVRSPRHYLLPICHHHLQVPCSSGWAAYYHPPLQLSPVPASLTPQESTSRLQEQMILICLIPTEDTLLTTAYI